MNVDVNSHNTAIVVTDVQIAAKANRYANEGFYFCAMGSAYPKVKFNIILFTCLLNTEVMKKWASGFIKLGLKEDGNFIGMSHPIEETPLPETAPPETEPEDIPEEIPEEAIPEEIPEEAIPSVTDLLATVTKAVSASTEHSFYKTKPKLKPKKKSYKKKKIK